MPVMVVFVLIFGESECLLIFWCFLFGHHESQIHFYLIFFYIIISFILYSFV